MEAGNLRTERLNGERPSHAAHLSFAVALLGDPDVGESLWPEHLGGPRTPEHAEEVLASDIAHWRRHGFGVWYWRELATMRLAARAGLQWRLVAGAQAVELVWTVAPQWWGKGYATETSRAAIDLAFGRLGLDELVAVTVATNDASRRVASSLGMSLDGELEQDGLPCVLYRLRRPPSGGGATRGGTHMR